MMFEVGSNRNTKLIAQDGNTYMAVIVNEGEGSAELTYQAGGEIRTVSAVLKDGVYHEKESEK